MLSLAKLGHGSVDYYEETVARGIEEYYTGAKEAPGQWVGDSSARLGLDGEVDADAFRRVMHHADPQDGVPLTDERAELSVAGFDATFSAPKSASLLFALGDPEASNEVRNAHDHAVRAAFDAYQQVARGRRGHGGLELVDGDGFLAAAYRHRTSRAAEPHLHTHVVIANVVYAPIDGRWSALDALPLYSWCRPVGHLYNAQLRYELTRRLGVRWNTPTNGMAEMTGFSPKLLRAFSTRRREIESKLHRSGRHGAKAAQKAAYATRKAKDKNLDGHQLLEQWRQSAAELGMDTNSLAKVTGKGRTPIVPALGSDEAEALYRWLARPEGLTARRSTFDKRHVIEAVCDALTDGAQVHQVLELADGFLGSEHVLALDADRSLTLRRGDGRLVPSGAALSRYTTPEMVATERQLLERAAFRRHERTGIVPSTHVDRALANREVQLSAEQTAMVRSICGSGAGVDIVEGVAGAGKTTALRAAHDAWTRSGYRVVGASLAAKAAQRLEDATGIPSVTVDRLLGQLDRTLALSDRDVIVVDEAAMVGTRKLHRLLTHAERAGAKVVLIGDPRQLPEIEAGGAFTALSRTLGTSALTVNRRQQEPWERDALAQLRAGDSDAALAAYRANGRVHEHDRSRADLVADWDLARTAGVDALMLAARISDVDDLNRRSRDLLRSEGDIGPTDDVVLDGRGYSVGDEVLALRNAYDLEILNGTRATITRIDRRHEQLHVVDEHGQPRTVPFAYADAGHLTHGYATTIHKAQGATVERAFVLVDDTLAAEHAYTAMSRASVRTDLYIEPPRVAIETHAPVIETDMSDRLATALRRSVRQQLAIDHTPHELAPIEALRAERDRLRERLRDRPLDHSVELRRLQERIASTRRSLEQASWRQDQARQQLDKLGPVGRKVHRRERTEYERREHSATLDIDRLSTELKTMTMRHGAATRLQRDYSTWEEQHRPELDRYMELDHTVWTREVGTRAVRIETPTPTRDLGLGLGL